MFDITAELQAPGEGVAGGAGVVGALPVVVDLLHYFVELTVRLHYFAIAVERGEAGPAEIADGD